MARLIESREAWNVFNPRIDQFIKTVSVRFQKDETGKVSLLASILMLALVGLAGLVGNNGHVAKEKLEIQNAADSTAYSSALWMARGMNALTATNHMLGEATALAAVHEAFGGPELDLSISRSTNENSTLNRIIQGLQKSAPVIPSIYSPPPIPSLDKRVVDFVANRMAPKNAAKMEAFATIYDSRMALKRQLAVILPAKSIANLGFLVPPPWGYATAGAAYVVHIAGTANLVLIGKEWFVIEAIEAIAKIFKPMKSVIETKLVPTLVAHANFVASYDPETGQTKPGILNGAVERVVLDLEKRLAVEASLFPKFEDLRLPVTPEPNPNMGGTSQPTQGWGSDKPPVFPLPELNINRMNNKLDDALNEIKDRIDKLENDVDDLDQFEKDIDRRLEDDDLEAGEEAELKKEKQEIEESRLSKQNRIDELQAKHAEVISERIRLTNGVEPLPTESDNPSVKSIPGELDQNQERYTQWVRATYPQTDAFRSPIRAWLEKWAPKSNAAEHFEKWSNRYTLVKAWQFRSGYRTRVTNERVAWQKKVKPSRMLVMIDSYRGQRDRKGFERWTGTSQNAKREAEKLFTLVGVAHREYQPLFSRVLYPSPSESGMTAYAQAIFYNANRQSPVSGRSETQEKLGWDTLNWDPAISIPEWGAAAHQSQPKWPWDAFDGVVQEEVANVKLNWQAKLMPVQPKRLKDTAVTLEGNARKNIEHAEKYFEKLGNH